MDAVRRFVIVGAGAVLTAPAAFADARTALKGGGSVIVPSPYRTATDYPNYADRSDPALVAYRKWRPTMSGYPDCDGMVAAGRTGDYETLDRFVGTARAALSLQWGDADRIPETIWSGDERRYQPARADGPDGAEITCQLSVHRSGFFDVYHEPASLFARADRRGVHIAVWLFDRHGGLKGARKMATRIAASFET